MTVSIDNTLKIIELGITDPLAQENFKRLKILLRETPFIKMNPFFFAINITGTVTNFKFKHNLGFVPKDVVLLAVSGGFSVTFHYDLFDKDFIVLSTTGGCTIRCILGAYKDESA